VPRHLNFRQSHTLQKPTYLPPTIFKIPRNPKQPIDMGNIECPILDMLLEALPIDSVVIHICFYKDRNRQLLPHIWNSVVKTCRSHNPSFWSFWGAEQIAHKSPHVHTPIHTRGKPLFSSSMTSRRDVEVALQKWVRGGGSIHFFGGTNGQLR